MIRFFFTKIPINLYYFQNFLVDEHLMRIEIKRLRALLNSKSDNVMNLETRRLQLQTVNKNDNSFIIISSYLSRLLKNVVVK